MSLLLLDFVIEQDEIEFKNIVILLFCFVIDWFVVITLSPHQSKGVSYIIQQLVSGHGRIASFY